MPWTLKAGSEIVAELGTETPGSTPDTRSWPVRPNAAFDRLRPTIALFTAARSDFSEPMPGSLTGIANEDERSRAIREWLRNSPAAQRRSEADRQLRALDLSVVDDAGNTVPFWNVSISALPLPPTPGRVHHTMKDAGFGDEPPFYMVFATLREPMVGPGAPPIGGPVLRGVVSVMVMRNRILLFGVAMLLGGLGGMLGSIVGNAAGKRGLFIGGAVGGIIGAWLSGVIASRRQWIPRSAALGASAGAATGFLLAALVATQTLGSPVGPILSTVLIGVGAVVGSRFQPRG
jgi:hypothetical protein